MSLFTDGPPASIEDLAAQDSQLLAVASTEGLDVTQKLALARDDLAMELTGMMSSLHPGEQVFWPAPQARLDRVAVTAPLKLWHTCRTLEMVYADAYNNQRNDRYGAKRDQFHRMAEAAREKVRQIGLGMVADPVPQAGTPTVSAAPGSLADGCYYVTMAWVNAEGEEGASAVPAAITITRSTLRVQPPAAPAAAAGWNVYAGTAPENMVRQNSSLLGTGDTWQQNTALISTGQAPGAGQEPAFLKPIPRILQRG